jgi:undecaprenyl diphosphate synthase
MADRLSSDGRHSVGDVPHHVAIIMDGNGRWAKARGEPRRVGHRAGVNTVRSTIEESVRQGVQVLTLFAFSSENWRRPDSEVDFLMELFINALEREVKRMRKNGIRLRVIGDIAAFPQKLQKRIHEAEVATHDNTGLVLQVAANYGGRWDIVQAARRLAEAVKRGDISPDDIDEQLFASTTALGAVPDADLFIRTGGDLRLSNFLLWHSAYAELHFTPVLWPDFDVTAYRDALASFASRQRRFGRTGEQLQSSG